MISRKKKRKNPRRLQNSRLIPSGSAIALFGILIYCPLHTVALDPLARHRLMILRDMELFRLAVDDAGENEGGVLLATLALAIRFAASEVTQSGGGAEKLFPGDERLEFGTALSLDAGHSGRKPRAPRSQGPGTVQSLQYRALEPGKEPPGRSWTPENDPSN
jgi:hypothetical protein